MCVCAYVFCRRISSFFLPPFTLEPPPSIFSPLRLHSLSSLIPTMYPHGSPGKPARAAGMLGLVLCGSAAVNDPWPPWVGSLLFGTELYLGLTYRLDWWIAWGKTVIHIPQIAQWMRNESERERGTKRFSITTTNQLVTHLSTKQMGFFSNTKDLSIHLLFIIKKHRRREEKELRCKTTKAAQVSVLLCKLQWPHLYSFSVKWRNIIFVRKNIYISQSKELKRALFW